MNIFSRPIARHYGIENETLAYLSSVNGGGLSAAQIIALNTQMRAAKDGILTLGSITGKLSIVAPCLGTGFNVLLAPFTFIPGVQIVLNDGAKTATYTGITPGSGETLTDLITGDNSTFTSDTGWWSKSAGVDINSSSVGKCHFGSVSNGGISKLSLSTTGNLYKYNFVVSNHGGAGYVGLSIGAWVSIATGNGTKTGYWTSGGTFVQFISGSVAFTGDIDNALLTQVLSSDISGFNATACTAEAGFNGNALAFSAQIRITP